MSDLDLFTEPLTAKTAAHLLRRTTFGPTPAEIDAFVGLTAQQAVQTLIANGNYRPPQPVDLEVTRATAGKYYIQDETTLPGQYLPYEGLYTTEYGHFIKYWWLGLMIKPGSVSLLDKLTLFWQNHFVATRTSAYDYRFVWSYLNLLRDGALGNFRELATKVTKEPTMLRYLNGNENEVGKPNENYARELQELFTVGAVDAAGNKNYAEDDVKAAARVLTGWKYTNYNSQGSTTFTTFCSPAKHDTADKVFSDHYNSTVIAGRTGETAGELELNDLVSMLLAHPQCPRFLCRKLYRFFVNPNLTEAVETNVITPLSEFFAGPANDFAIRPVVEKLLCSQVFFEEANIGAMVKSPLDFVVGLMRYYTLDVPALTPTVTPFRKTMEYLYGKIRDMQLELLEQPSVLGYEPYCQPGYSRLWISTGTVAMRSDLTDKLTNAYRISEGATLDINPLARATALQPDFGDIPADAGAAPDSPSLTCEEILAGFCRHLYVFELVPSQQDFLIDTVMMQRVVRKTWQYEWDTYRRTVTYPANYTTAAVNNARTTVNNRLKNLTKSLLRMAEYQIC